MTVAPRAAARAPAPSRCRHRPRTARYRRPRRLRALPRDLDGRPPTRRRPAGRARGGEQAQLADRELALEEHPDHRAADDAGGADDRDGEGFASSCRAWLRYGLWSGRARREYTSGSSAPRQPRRAQSTPRQGRDHDRRRWPTGEDDDRPVPKDRPAAWAAGEPGVARRADRLRRGPWPGGAASRPCATG